MPSIFRNRLLQALYPDTIERLHLTAVALPLNRAVESPGTPIHEVLFLEDGLASMTASFQDGSDIAIGVFGHETVLCASALVSDSLSVHRVSMQIAGRGYITSSANARLEFARHGRFHTLVLNSNQENFLQTAQTAGCNARHSVEQRLARWLLLAADRIESPILALSQQQIAAMLGCNRSTVTIAAADLQRDRLIEYARTKIRILDRLGLEARSCECYRALVEDIEPHENGIHD